MSCQIIQRIQKTKGQHVTIINTLMSKKCEKSSYIFFASIKIAFVFS